MKFVAGFVWLAVALLFVCFLPQLSLLLIAWLALLVTVLFLIPYREQ